MNEIGADCEEVYQSALTLLRSLGQSTKQATVTNYAGPSVVDASKDFHGALTSAADALGVALRGFVTAIEDHASSLRAVAVTLNAAEADATAKAAALLDEVAGATDNSPQAQQGNGTGTTAQGHASKTGGI